MPKLSGGELAVAYGTDLIAPAREIFSFKKKFNDNITVVGGMFEGKYMTAAEMQAIAEIPSPQVLRGMFVNVINSPIQGMVIALSKIAEKKTCKYPNRPIKSLVCLISFEALPFSQVTFYHRCQSTFPTWDWTGKNFDGDP